MAIDKFKILVTSQKGGVGKSTIAANLAAYYAAKQQSVTLVDFDLHGSSSNWLKRAPAIGVAIQHIPLPLNSSNNSSLMEARTHIRRASMSSEITIADLTWSDAIAGELLFQFDLIIIPTSTSEIELAATASFIARHSWVFNSRTHVPPNLLITPTRIRTDQLHGNAFTQQRFPVPFLLSPAILESQSARDAYECAYLKDLADPCGQSFREFGNAVIRCQAIHQTQILKLSDQSSQYTRHPAGGFSIRGSLNNYQNVLHNYRFHKKITY